jgi:GntR family transcriptional repressor for pyruvate dehydrogenase complex
MMKRKEPEQAKKKQRHEVAADTLMSKIYSGELKPGTKLPTEKQLAESMEIDRTSLRVALKQLEAMQLLEIRQGDGIYVKDFMEHAGLDFLRLLTMQGAEKAPVIDEYLLDELWEFWEIFLPQTVVLAFRKFSPRDLKAMLDLLDEELAHIGDDDMIVQYEIKHQDMMARIANNMVLTLLYNSSRPLREKMVRIFISHITKKEKKEHVLVKIRLLKEYSRGDIMDAIRGAEEYRKLLSHYRKKAIRSIKEKGKPR